MEQDIRTVDQIVEHLLSAPHLDVKRTSPWTVTICNTCHDPDHVVYVSVDNVDALIAKLQAARDAAVPA